MFKKDGDKVTKKVLTLQVQLNDRVDLLAESIKNEFLLEFGLSLAWAGTRLTEHESMIIEAQFMSKV